MSRKTRRPIPAWNRISMQTQQNKHDDIVHMQKKKKKTHKEEWQGHGFNKNSTYGRFISVFLQKWQETKLNYYFFPPAPRKWFKIMLQTENNM